MQLSRALAAAALLLAPRAAWAEGVVNVDTTHAVWHEAPTRTTMTVYTPAVEARATPAEWVTLRAGYEADVVSGASVAVKAGSAYQAANPAADVVTTASVRDLRHVARGGFTLRKDLTQLTAGYSYGTENDYRSHTVAIAARTDVFDRATTFELGYARNLDEVCDRAQAAGDPAVRHRALEDSRGCFAKAAPTRVARDVGVDGLQATWGQAWTPVLTTGLTWTGQIVTGFQSNPYRSVVLADGLRAQEHVPNERARQSLTARAAWYLRPLKAALRAQVRGYWDTWDVAGVTGELELEKYLAERLRVAMRGRVHRQGGALFWSDDYTGGDPPRGPKGQYWTGDRELSPLTSALGGLRVTYLAGGDGHRVAGLFEAFKATAFGDVVAFAYDEYTLGGVAVDGRALLAGGALAAEF